MANIGEQQQDKTIYAGEIAGKPVYAAPTDASLYLTFKEAAKYVATMNKMNYLGHSDWRLPTQAELTLLFANHNKGALKDSFNLTGFPQNQNPNKPQRQGWYWSDKQANKLGAYGIDMASGNQFTYGLRLKSSVRFVR